MLGLLGLEEIIYGGVRKPLVESFKNKKSNNRDHKVAKGDKSLSDDTQKEKTL